MDPVTPARRNCECVGNSQEKSNRRGVQGIFISTWICVPHRRAQAGFSDLNKEVEA